MINSLPTGPAWHYRKVTVTGDRVDHNGVHLSEDVELWFRDPVECIAELIGNPAFNGSISYAPEHVYTDSSCESRIWDEMWTADWWWTTQVSLRLMLHINPNPCTRKKLNLVAQSAWSFFLLTKQICQSFRGIKKHIQFTLPLETSEKLSAGNLLPMLHFLLGTYQ